jgi:uncharacterized protein YkwD
MFRKYSQATLLLSLFSLLLFSSFSSPALLIKDKDKDKDKDKGKSEKESSEFDYDKLDALILKEINKMRTEAVIDSLEHNDILGMAAGNQAEAMAKKGEVSLVQGSKKYKTTAKRVIASGGTKNAEEIVIAVPAYKGKEEFKPEKIIEEIFAKWKISKKDKPLILNGNNVYAGVSSKLDEDKKKMYISVVFGSYNTFNQGADKRKELDLPYTKKVKKLKSPVNATKECKYCDRFKDYVTLQKGLSVRDNKVYLKYDNLRAFKKLIRKPKDGLAVDIIQRQQYDKPDYNILDNNLVSKGILLKKMYSSDIYKKNLAKPAKKGKSATSLEVCLGTLPKKLEGEYEMNLIIIQENKVCRTVMRSYLEAGDQASSTPLQMLVMPDSTVYLKPPFVPKSESTVLNFVVPFEKNKYDYKVEDIQPFLAALQEPDFIIEGLYIYAYSSIEGDSVANANLQKKRAESIISAFKNIQASPISTSIKTNDSWDLFRLELEGGAFDNLTKMTKKQAIKEINSKGLAKDLEQYLAKERFAQIVMDITYDIKGKKEEKFSVAQFNKAVKKSDTRQAMKIQYFIANSIKKSKYTMDNSWNKMEIPKEAKYSGVLNNQVVMSYQLANYTVNEDQYKELQELAKLDPSNSIITFNNLFCYIKLDELGDAKQQADVQRKIDGLYSSTVPKKMVDGLNIEYQFKVMDALDTLESAEAQIQACIDKIKSFYNFKESSWQNSLKLAYVFERFKDYRFAASLLDPYIEQPKVDEQLLFTYISLCAQVPERLKSRLFVSAMRKAQKANSSRYCELFGDPFLTFQVLDNPFVKEDYNKANCKQGE